MTAARATALSIALFAVVGCAKPNAANIALRKQVQDQQTQIEQLNRRHAADVANLKALENGPSSAPSYGAPNDLFTTHGIRLGRLTGPGDFDPASPGIDGLVVHVVPTDDDGDDFKAAGAITVEAFDLTDAGRRVGRWAFTVAQAKPMWNGNGLRYEYVVPCPWQDKPTAKQLTVKVTFVDTLTGRSFDTQQIVALRAE